MELEEKLGQVKRREVESHFTQYRDHEVIFREKSFIGIVRVDRISASNWGVSVELTTVPKPGFLYPHPEPFSFTVSASWEVLGVGENSLSASYAGWSLYCDPETVQGAIALAAGFDPKEPVALIECMLSSFLILKKGELEKILEKYQKAKQGKK